MGKTYESITPEIDSWIQQQPMFFVATAPLNSSGHINCSPKGLDSLRILDPHTVAYLDLTGSGAETIAHVRENGRIVLMFCAFDGPPKIIRLHGTGVVFQSNDPRMQELLDRFDFFPGARSVIKINVNRISDSCGYGVPKFQFQGQRDTLLRWTEQKTEAGIVEYRHQKNEFSIDHLPAFDSSD